MAKRKHREVSNKSVASDTGSTARRTVEGYLFTFRDVLPDKSRHGWRQDSRFSEGLNELGAPVQLCMRNVSSDTGGEMKFEVARPWVYQHLKDKANSPIPEFIYDVSFTVSADKSVGPFYDTDRFTLLNKRSVWSARAIVLLLVAENGMYLKFACDELKADEEVVRVAVTQTGHAIHVAHRRFLGDDDVVYAAMETVPAVFKYASYDVRTTKRHGLLAVRSRGNLIDSIPDGYRSKEMFIAAVGNDLDTLNLVPSYLWRNETFVIDMMSVVDPEIVLNKASSSVCGNLNVLTAAVLKDPSLDKKWIPAAHKDDLKELAASIIGAQTMHDGSATPASAT